MINHSGTESPKTRLAVCMIILAVGMLMLPACGKKGPPVPPSVIPPPVITGIDISLTGSMMTLKWPVPKWDEEDDNALAGFYVYRSQMPLSEIDCTDCPVRFQKIADIRIENHAPQARFEEPLDKGFRYLYKVSAYSAAGYEGEQSAAVTVEY